MPGTIAFAATHHDPDGLLYRQTERLLPLLSDLYSQMTVVVTSATPTSTRELLHSSQVFVHDRGTDLPETLEYLGRWRRTSIELALQEAPQATHIHFCDFDRILHWAERYPDELRAVLEQIQAVDVTVLGRTPRAFHSHPRVQCDTEAIINHVFAIASGCAWDVTAASRGLSRRAAERLVAGCDDDTIGNDCSWMLYLQGYPDLTWNHVLTEGLEFETLDRYSAAEMEAAGGSEAMLERIDNNPHNWVTRLETARIEAASIARYRREP